MTLLLNYLTFTEPGNSGLQLVNGGHAVIIVRDESVKPPAELVLLLNDEMCDGTASTVRGLVPPESDALVVEVHYAGLSGLTGRLYTIENVLEYQTYHYNNNT